MQQRYEKCYCSAALTTVVAVGLWLAALHMITLHSSTYRETITMHVHVTQRPEYEASASVDQPDNGQHLAASAPTAAEQPAAASQPATTTLMAVDRMIVLARHKENISWLEEHFSNIPYVIYQPGKGAEARAYLQFIVDNYANLPKTTVFLHAHQHSWHMHDIVPQLHRLRWGVVPFANLRYKGQAGLEGVDLYPRDPGSITWDDKVKAVSEAFQDLWQGALSQELHWKVPKKVFAPPCAQLMVGRAAIRQHPRQFYQRILEWLAQAEGDPRFVARALEYAWHIIFGEPPILQPLPKCELYTCEGSRQ